MLVFLNIVQHVQDGFFIVGQQLEVAEHLHRLLTEHPFQQRVDVIEVIVKGVPVQPSYANQLVHRHLGQGLGFHAGFQRARQQLFRLKACDLVLHDAALPSMKARMIIPFPRRRDNRQFPRFVHPAGSAAPVSQGQCVP